MKLHVGCGTIYLLGYKNLDIPGKGVFRSYERPDLIEKYGTTVDKYYLRHQDKTIDKLRKGPTDKEIVCDEFGWFENLPANDGEVEELISRQVLEHFSRVELEKQVIPEIYRVMKHDGIVRISIPDFEQTLKKVIETQDEFYIRHALGPRSSQRGFHCTGFSKEDLISLFTCKGFIFVGDDENPHNYPSICLIFRKP
jgi:hypothetical protein